MLNGDSVITSRNEPAPVAVMDRLGLLAFIQTQTLENPAETQTKSLEIATAEFDGILARVRALDAALTGIEDEMADSAPWTPGRAPQLQ